MATVSTKYLTPMRALLAQDIRAILAAKTQADASNIPDEIGLGDLGLDSLALSDLAEAIEEKFAVPIPDRMLPAALTVGQLVALVHGNLGSYEDLGGHEDSPGSAFFVPEPAD